MSGWKVYNNKGKVVEQYEPFFDSGFDFVLPSVASIPSTGSGTPSATDGGVKIKMFYDPLGRVIRTVIPDLSEQRVVYGTPVTLNAVTESSKLSAPHSVGIEHAPSPWINYAYDANDLAPKTHSGGGGVDSTHHYTPKSSLVDALCAFIQPY